MYIASPMHHDDDGGGHSDGEGDYHAYGDNDDDNGENNNDNDNGGGTVKYDYGHDGGGGGDDDTDDSMASDASSGPCHDSMYFSNDDSNSKYSSCPCNKNEKVIMRNIGSKRGTVEERKKSGLDKRGGGSQLVVPKTSNINVNTSTVPSSAAKARKPKWMSKGNN
ncbi:hypothetical protein Scep_022207 [Stephania cephalantha]|uniref:Uncharacterized protein n=1 Tax=Stephania cephalantha TaxID=152367 RepID=A0AAP0FA04_9MAGN